jgi:pimeloyl-ACP methyl ester carboxylesterase
MFFFKNKAEKPNLPGEERTWQSQGHKIVYSVSGKGTPLLLIHGINAAAWGFEFRKNIAELSNHYKVYLPDLPGFGRSERKAITYTAETYINFIAEFAEFIATTENQPPLVIANSLSAAHLIGAVIQKPEVFASLIISCPTGLERLDFAPRKGFHKLLMSPFGSVLFRLLGTRRATRVFLARDGYKDPKVIDNELIEAYYWSTHQPYAKYAPIAFVSGMLNHSVKPEWALIDQPVLLLWGKEAKITPVEDAQKFLELRPETTFKVIEDARLAPQDEQPERFHQSILDWLAFEANPPQTAVAG